MSVTSCQCPLCHGGAAASGFDGHERARVYCERCATFDLTKAARSALAGAGEARLAELAGLARNPPEGKLLEISRAAVAYVPKEALKDRPAPDWLATS